MSENAQGLLVVISGPSGVGKTTIVHRVRETFDAVFSISATTRPISKSETNGKDYLFVSNEEFEEKIGNGEFLEHAEVFGCHRYGTLRTPVLETLHVGKIVLLDIDVQGGIQVSKNMPESLRIFILPPNEDSLLQRLESRARDDVESIQRRFREAKKEIKLAKESNAYQYFITNDNLELAVAETLSIIKQTRSNTTTAS
ncbi:MAG: guanylate kinase [Phycisphaerales bacterium]|jgi:guanylate kinase|nr:guanylate kinase [Phycisphaerales bacterium]